MAMTYKKPCGGCQQIFGEYERALLPERVQTLIWNRKGKDSEGKRSADIPEGDRCRPCEDTRIHNFGGIDASELDEVRKTHPEIDAKYNLLRDCNARGETCGKKRKHEKVPVEHLVTKQKKKFKESYRENEFWTLDDVVVDHGVDGKYKDHKSRLEYVRDILQLEIQEESDDEGNMQQGIYVAKGKKIIRTGNEQSVTQSKVGKAADKKAASSSAREMGAALRPGSNYKSAAEIRTLAEKAQQNLEESQESGSDSSEGNNESDETTTSHSDSGSSSSCFGFANRTPTKKGTKPLKPSSTSSAGRQKAPKNDEKLPEPPVQSVSRGRGGRGRGSNTPLKKIPLNKTPLTNPGSNPEAGGGSLESGNLKVKVPQKTPDEKVLDSGREACDGVLNKYSPEQIFDGQFKQRVIQAACTKLNEHISKLGLVTGTFQPQAESLIQELTDTMNDTSHAWDFFHRARTQASLHKMIYEWSHADEALFGKLSSRIWRMITTNGATFFAKDFSKESVECFFRILCAKVDIILHDS